MPAVQLRIKFSLSLSLPVGETQHFAAAAFNRWECNERGKLLLPCVYKTAVVFHAHYILTDTAAPSWRLKGAVSKSAWWLRLWISTLKVVSESRVTWATSESILVFLDLSLLDLDPMYWQTDVTQKNQLMLSPIRGMDMTICRRASATIFPRLYQQMVTGHTSWSLLLYVHVGLLAQPNKVRLVILYFHLLTLEMMSDSIAASATSVSVLVSRRPIYSRLRLDVCYRQTAQTLDVRQTSDSIIA